VDSNNRTLVGGRQFDDLVAGPHGKWLGMDIDTEKTDWHPKKSVVKITLVDSIGKTLHEWNDPSPEHKYVLTPFGQILGYAHQKTTLLYDPLTGKVKNLALFSSNGPDLVFPFVMEVGNYDGDDGLVSTRDVNLIVPLGKYENIRATKPPLKTLSDEGAFITGRDPETDEATMIGFYSVEGVSYWKD
jgi:hypothetical protein